MSEDESFSEEEGEREEGRKGEREGGRVREREREMCVNQGLLKEILNWDFTKANT